MVSTTRKRTTRKTWFLQQGSRLPGNHIFYNKAADYHKKRGFYNKEVDYQVKCGFYSKAADYQVKHGFYKAADYQVNVVSATRKQRTTR